MGKHSTSLCAFKGRLRELLSAKIHKLALDPGEVRAIAASADFSKKFQEAEYSQSDLCTSMCSAFRSGKWKKERSDEGDHQALYMKINQCNDSIDGLRVTLRWNIHHPLSSTATTLIWLCIFPYILLHFDVHGIQYISICHSQSLHFKMNPPSKYFQFYAW